MSHMSAVRPRWAGALALLASIVTLASSAGCPDVTPRDDDGTCSVARPLPPNLPLTDEVGGPGDAADCKRIRPLRNGMATVEYRIGSAFDRHRLRGLVTIYDARANVIAQKVVDPGESIYRLSFPVRRDTDYFAEIRASQGAHTYTVKAELTTVDPCGSCRPDQKCVQGRCVDPMTGCGACGPDEVCQGRRCVSACNPPCPNEFRCRVGADKIPLCERGGPVVTGGCAGGCPSGSYCRSGACVPLAHAGCSVVGVTARENGGATVTLGCGKNQGIERGMVAVACGKLRLRVSKVMMNQSLALTNHPVTAMAQCKKVTF